MCTRVYVYIYAAACACWCVCTYVCARACGCIPLVFARECISASAWPRVYRSAFARFLMSKTCKIVAFLQKKAFFAFFFAFFSKKIWSVQKKVLTLRHENKKKQPFKHSKL